MTELSKFFNAAKIGSDCFLCHEPIYMVQILYPERMEVIVNDCKIAHMDCYAKFSQFKKPHHQNNVAVCRGQHRSVRWANGFMRDDWE
jgi:hypothetical protein